MTLVTSGNIPCPWQKSRLLRTPYEIHVLAITTTRELSLHRVHSNRLAQRGQDWDLFTF
jgi:hypothetical protein